MAFIKTETSLKDCYVIEPQVFGDDRGFFMETYSKKEFEKIGIDNNFVQDNHSKSKKGVLRGLHFQIGEMQQTKMVRVTKGSVYDIAVDIRKDSSTFGKWFGVILSAENKKILYIPKGFAHGFITLEDDTDFLYKCDNYYSKEHEVGISYNDVNIGINWAQIIEDFQIMNLEISEKDKNLLSLNEFITLHL